MHCNGICNSVALKLCCTSTNDCELVGTAGFRSQNHLTAWLTELGETQKSIWKKVSSLRGVHIAGEGNPVWIVWGY